jgi:hypothetical protein
VPCISFNNSIAAENYTFESLNTSGAAQLNGIKCKGPLVTQGDTQIRNSELKSVKSCGEVDLRYSTAGAMTVSGRFYASNCPQLGSIQAAGFTKLENCPDVQGIVAAGELFLTRTRVYGDTVYSGAQAQIEESTITGTLECSSERLEIRNSSIQHIVVKPTHNFGFYDLFWLRFLRPTPISEQVVVLTGKSCNIGSISFVEGCKGKVILQDGAKVRGKISGACA